MSTAEADIILDLPIERLRGFLRDLGNIGRCLGVVEDVVKEGGQARWILKSQQARITRTREVRARFKELDENRASWEARGGALSISGDYQLEPRDGSTRLKSRLTFELSGPLGAIMGPMNSLTIDSRLKGFLQCVREGSSRIT
ncbi:MAG: SRPBCC family protein [Candidatus Bathyarchaeia archaeon]